jgi:NADH:ubiquinone oxidoreductase subunit F (NADH-binding)
MNALLLPCPTHHDPHQAIHVHPGPRVLRHLEVGPTLADHRGLHGAAPRWTAPELLERLREVDVHGRGGAGFPFARKLETARNTRGRTTVVVNASEGEPASFKDAALALTRPHLVLDGAAVVARALRARSVHLVVPTDRPGVGRRLSRAVVEREQRDRGLRWVVHHAAPRFVAGQARAVIELISGRENLPVTAWKPEARSGYRGRPTLLSNAETFAQVGLVALGGPGRYRELGTPREPGTMLVTLHGGERPQVLEVAHGTPWYDVLPAESLARPALVGGFHGTWAPPGALADLTVSRAAMAERGLALGAGVVLPLGRGECPLYRTARITAYLANQSAGRCGPCFNGLPALAHAVWRAHDGEPSAPRLHELTGLVTRRGACAHPDGTARMVESLLAACPEEVEAHARGACAYAAPAPGAGGSHTDAQRSGARP